MINVSPVLFQVIQLVVGFIVKGTWKYSCTFYNSRMQRYMEISVFLYGSTVQSDMEISMYLYGSSMQRYMEISMYLCIVETYRNTENSMYLNGSTMQRYMDHPSESKFFFEVN